MKELTDYAKAYTEIDDKMLIGEGTFGNVYLVRTLAGDQQRALKVIDMQRAPERYKPSSYSDLENLTSMVHQNLVRYHDVFYDSQENKAYLVMDYHERCCLADIIVFYHSHKKYIPESVVWRVLAHMMAALCYYHTPFKSGASHMGRMVHRDIKPANIFLAADGYCKLVDSASFRLLDKTTINSTIFGTLGYCSPEVLKMEQYSDKSDIWALGATIYAMCMQRPLCKETDPEKQREAISSIESIDITSAGYSTQLNTILNFMLASNPAKRFSASDLYSFPALRDYYAPASEGWGLDFS
ncbi:Kinase, NEK [Giardia duodenalis]|uniref:Kinase, NEK n=2 Tax=Giardia intestinalis TaxID=5741 RepID=A8B7S7_GIAIC|nr:Kinase, NEK [Giardia intestinalis]ESU37929.1 Serine/threonine protein kinase [Giardia intestinalis]KAE8305400.1 Kinase, NEK [Giardia intestinalis]|eukprot:XP_001708873.1 Kinase, NEK [Giardia lamblia ATCC 50803]